MSSSSTLDAVRAALRWAVRQGMAIPGLMSTGELTRLSRVFAGDERWSFELYEPLRAFGHAYYRLELSDAPAPVCFADLLSALDQLALADTRRAPSEHSVYLRGLREHDWQLMAYPSAECMRELGYEATSEGISRLRQQNLAGWSQHARYCKSLIRQVAKQLPGETAVVIGAGKVYDIPLLDLVERYKKLILVDIDKSALEATVARAVTEPEQLRRIELVSNDVTGIAEYFRQAVDTIINSAETAASARTELLALLYSYRGTPPPKLFPQERVDTIYSVMVLTQLATPLTRYAEARFSERFPRTNATTERHFQIALGQFTHRVQHAHVQAILESCQSFSISSDVAEHYTIADTDGATRAVSGELPLVGAQRLDELLPSGVERIAGVEWTWPRVVPRPGTGKQGTSLRVQGVVGRAP